jgi:hypothetical protein
MVPPLAERLRAVPKKNPPALIFIRERIPSC